MKIFHFSFAFIQKRAFWLVFCHFCSILPYNAQLAKLADAPGLGPDAARHVGSSPTLRTILPPPLGVFFPVLRG